MADTKFPVVVPFGRYRTTARDWYQWLQSFPGYDGIQRCTPCLHEPSKPDVDGVRQSMVTPKDYTPELPKRVRTNRQFAYLEDARDALDAITDLDALEDLHA